MAKTIATKVIDYPFHCTPTMKKRLDYAMKNKKFNFYIDTLKQL